MRAHIIENGIVINTIEVESLDFMPNLISGETGGIGWLWDGETLSPPPAPPPVVPDSVTMAQARKSLILSGVSITSVNAAIAAIPDATQRQLAETDWEYSTSVRRDSALMASLAPALGFTDEQIDEMFLLADSL
jgi:hypothetical protein